MKVMTAREVENRFGITSEQLDQWEQDAAQGGDKSLFLPNERGEL